MADGRLWEEREASALNSDKLLCLSQVTVGKGSMHHKRPLSRPIWRLALHGAAGFLWHFVTVFPRTVTKCQSSNVQRQHLRWGAIARQSMVGLLTLRAEGQVIQAARALYAAQMRPTWITMAALGRYIGQLALLQQHMDKLPLTAQMLSEVVESREAFAVRRIRWVVTTSVKKRHYLERWELIKRARVERLMKSTVVRATLDESLLLLQEEFSVF